MSNKEKCISCSVVPEDVMVLSCNHCICLFCASNQVSRQGKTENYSIRCNRCRQVTQIDEGLYIQLMKLVDETTKLPKRHQKVLNRQHVIRQERRNLVNYGHDSDLQRTCNWHPEYPIMYICKTCNDTFICPQCLINGCHKHHESNTIQKQGQKIKGKLQQDLSKITDKIEQLQKMQQARLANIQQRKRELQKLRNTAKQQYDQIKQAIIKQENTVIAKCNQLIASHQKQEQSFKLDIAYQIKIYEDQRIDFIDILNPLLQQSIMGQSRALQKMMMINLVESYKKFAKVTQRDRENYIKIAEQKMEEDIEVIEDLTKKIDRISIANFEHPKQEIYIGNTKNVSSLIKKYKYPNKDVPSTVQQQFVRSRNLPNSQSPRKASPPKKNDFFNLL